MRLLTEDAQALFHEGIRSLAKVEANGIKIDTVYLDKAIKSIEEDIEQCKKELYQSKIWKKWQRHFGRKAKLSSTEQIGTLLFEVMKFPCKERTYPSERFPEGRPKVDETAIRRVKIPFTKKYLKLKKLEKVKNTYFMGIRREVTPRGLLHPTVNLHRARTYRSSYQDPNFQNMPIRDPDQGQRVRKAFIARKKRRIVERDFSTLEVRIAYCYHKDPNMLRYLKDKTKDMHRDKAQELFFLKKELVSKALRHTSKNMLVFPQFYGSRYPDCAKNIWEAIHRQELTLEGTGITVVKHLKKKGIKRLGKCDYESPLLEGTFVKHVYDVEKKLWEKDFPVYAQWKEEWWKSYLKKGRFWGYTGFTWEGVYRKNEVINYPVQSSAFHCELLCLNEIQRRIEKEKMDTLIIGQIHDSILSDVPDDELQWYLDMSEEVMTVWLPQQWSWITCPIEAEAEVTPIEGSWAEKKQWIRGSKEWKEKE